MEKYVVIMAGGSGTRLWTLPSKTRPKQLIHFDDGKCMLVQTIERICEIVPADKCFIITNSNLQDITRDTAKNLIPYSNIILEPEKKNTAASIAYTTLILKERFGEGLICFVPADGYAKDGKAYRKKIELAYTAAEKINDLVIIGITPTYPATGYGYIQIDNDNDAQRISTVLKFIEKPDFNTAQKLVSSGDFIWNGGILVGSMDAILARIKSFLPKRDTKISNAIKHEDGEAGTTYIENAYNEIQNVSFENGVLENSEGIHAISGFFDWDDIGSIDNMIAASTKDSILLCPPNKAHEVKALVEELRRNGYGNFL